MIPNNGYGGGRPRLCPLYTSTNWKIRSSSVANTLSRGLPEKIAMIELTHRARTPPPTACIKCISAFVAIFSATPEVSPGRNISNNMNSGKSWRTRVRSTKKEKKREYTGRTTFLRSVMVGAGGRVWGWKETAVGERLYFWKEDRLLLTHHLLVDGLFCIGRRLKM